MHPNDCDDPESADCGNQTPSVAANNPQKEHPFTEADSKEEADNQAAVIRQAVFSTDTKANTRLVRVNYSSSLSKSTANILPKRSSKQNFFYFQAGQIIDGSSSDTSSPAAAKTGNAIGTPRFTAQLASDGNSNSIRDNLGSSDYVFSIPILSMKGGRGMDINLAMTYNSRLWNRDGTSMSFNYNKGWPAPGWSLGYGRIIKNYDNTATGDASGSGFANNPGNYLLLLPDGTRVHLQSSYDSAALVYNHDSIDGTFINYNMRNGRLRYPDGTMVKYDLINNRLLPASIRDRNGNLITISYRDYDGRTDDNNNYYFPSRWSIDTIVDTRGRVVQFMYYGDGGGAIPSSSPTKPYASLAYIIAPTFNYGNRTIAWFDYKQITMNATFKSGYTKVNDPGSTLIVLNRIYFAATGRGYTFPEYNGYGMIQKISERRGMRLDINGGTYGDGNQIATTRYVFESGNLADSPKFTSRFEWWEGKTDHNGTPTTAESEYKYSRVGADTDTVIQDKVQYPANSDGKILEVVTETDNDSVAALPSFGKVVRVTYKEYPSGTMWKKIDYQYETETDGGVQRNSVIVTDKELKAIKTEYNYGTYGRLTAVKEYGYESTVQRKTTYQYSDAYLSERLLRLVTQVEITKGTEIASRTQYEYDNTTLRSLSGALPAGHDAAFDASKTSRGNVTKVKLWVKFGPDELIERAKYYDILGNLVEAQVSCCGTRVYNYVESNSYAQPISITDGPSGGPQLATNYSYDTATGLVTTITDPSGLSTSYNYDTDWRVSKVTPPSTDTNSTYTKIGFEQDSNFNDQQEYKKQIYYKEADGTAKTITTKSWLNGNEQILRRGVGTGASPSTFDTVATIYDGFGRLAQESNPYSGDTSGNSSNVYWTKNTYDLLSRLTTVTLPDNQTVQTSYSGATTQITDQVGRKRVSEVDGLGRIIKVTEQNPDDGNLNLVTDYSYDLLDNLKQSVMRNGTINQTRTYNYDGISRLISSTTPEGGTTSYTYTLNDDTMQTRTDGRGVTATYGYDGLNRLISIRYNDVANVVKAPNVDITYSVDRISTITSTDTATSAVVSKETFNYETTGLYRLISKAQQVDTQTYTTNYQQYSTANKVGLIVYHSGKKVRVNRDARGRLNGLDKLDSNNIVQEQYLSSVNYDVAGMITGLRLNDGVLSESYEYSTGATTDNRWQLTRQQVIKNPDSQTPTTLMEMNYKYNATSGLKFGALTTAGNPGQLLSVYNSQINGAARNQDFTYDNLGRVKTASGSSSDGSWQRSYEYDRYGNRTRVVNSLTGGQVQKINILSQNNEPTNKISSVITGESSSATYVFDNSGNLTDDGLRLYKYDSESRLVKITEKSNPNNVIASYAYDTSNRRIKKVVGSTSVHYVWEGNNVISEHNASTGAVIVESIYAGNRLVAQEAASISYFHPDYLSNRLITDASGNYAATISNEPFGEARAESGTQNKRRFTSYERDDETGMDYALNRQYAVTLGRFMQPDPVGGSILSPQSLNRYAYVGNDPVNFADPSGLFRLMLLSCRAEIINYDGLRATGREICTYAVDTSVEPLLEDPGFDCDFPEFDKLSPQQKALFGKAGASAYNSLNDAQKASFLNITGAMQNLGLNFGGLTLQEKNGIQQDRLLFNPEASGFQSSFRLSIDLAIANGKLNERKPLANEHPGMADFGVREDKSRYALQLGSGPAGIFADIDLGNPQQGFGPGGILGKIIHGVEVITPGQTDPFRIGKKLGKKITGYECKERKKGKK